MAGLFLLALGLILTVVAGAALQWYPSRIGGPAYWIDDKLFQPILGVMTPRSDWLALAGFAFLAALIISFVGYVLAARWALRRRDGSRRDLWIVIGFQIAISGWLAIQPYLSSQDIFSYAFYTHIFAWYHDNPYVATPRDFPFDPLFSAIFWKDQPSNYGPLWTYLSSLAPLLAGDRVGVTLLILKSFVIVPAIAATPLIWSALQTVRPDRRVLGTVLYAWNPLLLLETAEAGHNDVVMASLLIASFWLWCRGRRTSAIAALVLAALVKYVAIMLVPLYLVAWWREGRDQPRRILWTSAAVGITLTTLAFLPIYAGPSTFAVVEFGSNALAYTNSPGELVFRETRLLLGESPVFADLPLHYDGHWIGSSPSAILWSTPDEQRGHGVLMPTGTPLLVVEPETSSWVHVYEPKLGRFGFVRGSLTHPIPVPESSVVPGTTAAVLAGISQDAAARNANTIVRVASLLIFLPWYGMTLLRLARGPADPLALAHAITSTLVVYLLAVQSWFWPWYMIWVIPFAAIAPESTVALVALTMTLTTGLLNAQPSISPPPFLDWLYGSRVLLIYGLPVAVVVAWTQPGLRHRAGRVLCRVGGVAVARPAPALRLRRATALGNLPIVPPSEEIADAGDRRGLTPPLAGEGSLERATASRQGSFPRDGERTGEGCDSAGGAASRDRHEAPGNAPGVAERALGSEIPRAVGQVLAIATRPWGGRPIAVLVLALFALIACLVLNVPLQAIGGHQPPVIEWERDYDEALRLYSTGDYQGAVARLTSVVATVPNERTVRQLRIAANLQLGRYDETIPDLNALVEADPQSVELRVERGVMFARIQRGDRALNDFRFVMQAAPRDPVGYEWAGLVNFDRGNLEAASRQLAHALDLDPRNARIARELANVLASDDRLTDALAVYDDAVHLDPRDARAYADRAALLRHLGSTGATIPDLQQVLVLTDDTQQQQWAVHLLESQMHEASPVTGRAG